MKLFKKYKTRAYGMSYYRYYFQDHIPEWLDYYFRITVLRVWHILFGHKWRKWAKFSYVPKGKNGWATIESKQKRHCSCYAKQLRAWNKKNQRLLERMEKRFGKAIGTGYIGELYSVRFMTAELPEEVK